MIGKINRWDQILTKIAFFNKLVSKAQLAEAYSIQKKMDKSGNKVPIDDVFLKQNMVSKEKIEELRIATKRSFGKSFGVIALKKGPLKVAVFSMIC